MGINKLQFSKSERYRQLQLRSDYRLQFQGGLLTSPARTSFTSPAELEIAEPQAKQCPGPIPADSM
ncbi:hypothetical protein AB833_16000 [Chromatiales bacterium (ex Bugula neritina AB1)]|nr:hypothetical protein AB833_16000 [Chromatiales bacterium (ex Bugula neritina AB1)]